MSLEICVNYIVGASNYLLYLFTVVVFGFDLETLQSK